VNDCCFSCKVDCGHSDTKHCSWCFTEPTADAAMRRDAWNFSGMEQFVSIDNMSSEASVKPDTAESVSAGQSPATQSQKKSAESFLGDNANLVNLDNLISFPLSSPSRELLCCAFSHISVFSDSLEMPVEINPLVGYKCLQ